MTPEKEKTSSPIEGAVDAIKEMQRLAREAAEAAESPSVEETMAEMADLREARAAAQQRTYVVQPGDYLSKIALAVYGDASRWKEIYEANKDQIEDPDLIYPGQEFRIP